MTDHVDLSGEAPEAGSPPGRKYLSVREAAFIGVGSMVGAGIFALLGAATAPAAVWVSFLLAGAIAMLQGYSFAKLGARYPSAGGMGVMEASYISLLTLLGIPEELAIAATLLYRLCTTYLPPIWGWAALVWLRRHDEL